MSKITRIDNLFKSDGWSGTATRLVVMSLVLAGIYALPSAFIWYSRKFLSKEVEINGYDFALNVALILYAINVLGEVVNGIRLIRKTRKAGRNYE